MERKGTDGRKGKRKRRGGMDDLPQILSWLQGLN